jgi:hypothetical protein
LLAGPVAIAIGLVALAIAPAAQAASNRAEYVQEADQICASAQPSTFKAYFSLLKGAAKQVPEAKREMLGRHPRRLAKVIPGPMFTFVTRLSRVYTNETARLATLSAAPGDEAPVAAWLQQRSQATELAARSRTRLKHRRFGSFNRLFNQATSASDAAAKVVSDYGFTYCQLALGDAIGFTDPG